MATSGLEPLAQAGEAHALALDALQHPGGQDDPAAGDAWEAMEAHRDLALLVFLQRDHVAAVDIGAADRQADRGQKRIGSAALGRHHVERERLRGPACVTRPAQQHSKPGLALGDQVEPALYTGEHGVVVQRQVDVLDGGFGGAAPLGGVRVGQLAELDAHVVVGRREAIQRVAAARGLDVARQGEVEIGVTGALEALAEHGQARGVAAEVVAQAAQEDRLLGRGRLAHHLVHKALERGQELGRVDGRISRHRCLLCPHTIGL